MISTIILGFLQGLTEFLPISSSGHLIIARDLLNISIENDFLFDILLHLATALAIIVYFWRDILDMLRRPRENKTLWLAIILGTIPAAVFGLLINEEVVRKTGVVIVMLILGSIFFFVAERFAKQNERLSVKKGFWIGALQALALIPGTSRSGITIAGGLVFGMKREEAAKFSFFLGLPAILGAGLLSFLRSYEVVEFDLAILAGAITAFLTGILVIHWLLRFLRNHKLNIFAWYRIVLAVFLLFWM